MSRFETNEPSKAESCCFCCAHCCILYSALGIVIMTFFGYLVQNRSVAFEIASAQDYGAGEEAWDFAARANICYATASLYAVTLCIALYSRGAIATKRAKEQL
eukprot:TRINITY_DN6040_c0_g1_i1.p2 TRINITY_DN6040_c0_g1~~TRINITY_DN6040_c0_g1_i1.p2  ORF type:complete len:103 (+),score=32.47 TRINITY_DN6040_c0_g1_i1:88-396(+)